MKTSYQIPLRGIIGTMGLLLAFASPAFAQSSPGKIVQTSGSYCQNCDQGGYCDHCHGGCNHCNGGYCNGNRCCRGGLFGNRMGVSAISYARPPVLPPVRRYPKVYSRYWADHVTRDSGPAVRTAQAPSYPMIHTPTDTTQLGYTYVHVPFLHFRPEMLPPAPGPSWGTAAYCPGAGHTTYDSSGYYGNDSDESYESYQGGSVQPSPTPIQKQDPAKGPAARPEPVPVQGAPSVQRPPVVAPQPDQYFTGSRS